MSVIGLASESGAARASDPEDALFNEAYLGLLIALAARHYQDKSSGAAMPWMLAFIAVPLVVHRSVREQLPGSTAARLSNWIAGQPVVYAGFPQRALALTPFVRRGIRYAVRSQVIKISDGGIQSRIAATRYTKFISADAQEAGRQAAFLGRWFAKIGDVPAIFSQLGVMP
jgi:hypothetical protein